MLVLVLVLLLSSLSVAVSEVLSLSGVQAFQTHVHDTRAAVLVSYYVGGDEPDAGGAVGASQQLVKFLEQLDEKVGTYGIAVAKCDCADKANKKSCTGLRGVPSLVLYMEPPAINPYSKKNFRNGISFEGGALDARSIEKFISKAYPSKVQLVKAAEDETLQLVDESSETEWTALLFSEKDTISMLLKSIAFSFGDELKVVQTNGLTPEAIREKFPAGAAELTNLPALALVSRASKSQLTLFSGDLKDRTAIVDWIKHQTGLPDDSAAVLAESSSSTSGAGEEQRGEKGGSANKQKQQQQQQQQYRDPFTGETMKTFTSASFTVDSLHDEAAWIVAVVAESGKDSLGDDWGKLLGWCEGVIKPTVIVCPNDVGSSAAADDGFGDKFCKRELPYVALFPHGASSRKKIFASPAKGSHVYEFNSLESAKKNALSSLPDTSVFVIPEDGIQEFAQVSHGREVMSVVILSDKSSVPPMLRNLALSTSKFAQVAFMSNPSKQFLANIGNPKLPTAVALFVGADDLGKRETPTGAPPGSINFQLVVYDGNMFGPVRFATIQAFIFQAFSRTSFAEKFKANSDTSAASASVGESQKELIWVKSESDWNEHCGSAFRGICAIGLFKGADESATGVSELQAVMGRSGSAFKFISVDASCQFGFASRFGAQFDSLPAIAAYSAAKGRYALFSSTLKEEGIKTFLDSILAGKTNTASIPQRPELSASCDGQQFSASEVAPESEDDKASADDFMEEIRREEAERKARLKKEMEEEARRKREEEEATSNPKVIKRVVKKIVKKKKKTTTTKTEL